MTKIPRKITREADRFVTREMVLEILNDFEEKLSISGYSIHRRHEILKSGLTGYK